MEKNKIGYVSRNRRCNGYTVGDDMKETISKIRELSSGDESEQKLAQDMMRQMVRDGSPLDTSGFITDRIYDLVCVEGYVTASMEELALTEMSDVWMGSCFARVTIVRNNGMTCLPLVAVESEIEMNNAYRSVANLAAQMIAQSENARQ